MQKARYTAGFQFLFNFARPLFAVALAGEGFFGAAFFAWFQVERVPFDFFYDIFLLNLTLKTSQSAFERLAILKMDFCQLKIHLPLSTDLSIASHVKFTCPCYIGIAWK
jgi:hypothetical protein